MGLVDHFPFKGFLVEHVCPWVFSQMQHCGMAIVTWLQLNGGKCDCRSSSYKFKSPPVCRLGWKTKASAKLTQFYECVFPTPKFPSGWGQASVLPPPRPVSRAGPCSRVTAAPRLDLCSVLASDSYPLKQHGLSEDTPAEPQTFFMRTVEEGRSAFNLRVSAKEKHRPSIASENLNRGHATRKRGFTCLVRLFCLALWRWVDLLPAAVPSHAPPVTEILQPWACPSVLASLKPRPGHSHQNNHWVAYNLKNSTVYISCLYKPAGLLCHMINVRQNSNHKANTWHNKTWRNINSCTPKKKKTSKTILAIIQIEDDD